MSYNYDAELQPLVELLPGASQDISDPKQARVGFSQMVETLNADLDTSGVKMQNRDIPGPEGEPNIAVRIYSPEGLDKVAPCILHIHGGGFVIGTLDSELFAVLRRAPHSDD